MWIFCLLDYVTTHYLISVTDFSVEANPIMQSLLQLTHSVWSILVIKLILMFALGVGLCKLRDELKTRYIPLMWMVTIGQGLIALYGTGLTLRTIYG